MNIYDLNVRIAAETTVGKIKTVVFIMFIFI